MRDLREWTMFFEGERPLTCPYQGQRRPRSHGHHHLWTKLTRECFQRLTFVFGTKIGQLTLLEQGDFTPKLPWPTFPCRGEMHPKNFLRHNLEDFLTGKLPARIVNRIVSHGSNKG